MRYVRFNELAARLRELWGNDLELNKVTEAELATLMSMFDGIPSIQAGEQVIGAPTVTAGMLSFNNWWWDNVLLFRDMLEIDNTTFATQSEKSNFWAFSEDQQRVREGDNFVLEGWYFDLERVTWMRQNASNAVQMLGTVDMFHGAAYNERSEIGSPLKNLIQGTAPHVCTTSQLGLTNYTFGALVQPSFPLIPGRPLIAIKGTDGWAATNTARVHLYGKWRYNPALVKQLGGVEK